jgi:small multidrug resistance pump
MVYVYLALAIVAEVIATSALKASEQFTKIIPSVVVFLGYGTAFYLMTLVLRTMPIGVTYAIWSGAGIVLITLAGAIYFEQVPDVPAIVGIALIIVGVIVIQLFSQTIGE